MTARSSDITRLTVMAARRHSYYCPGRGAPTLRRGFLHAFTRSAGLHAQPPGALEGVSHGCLHGARAHRARPAGASVEERLGHEQDRDGEADERKRGHDSDDHRARHAP